MRDHSAGPEAIVHRLGPDQHPLAAVLGSPTALAIDAAMGSAGGKLRDRRRRSSFATNRSTIRSALAVMSDFSAFERRRRVSGFAVKSDAGAGGQRRRAAQRVAAKQPGSCDRSSSRPTPTKTPLRSFSALITLSYRVRANISYFSSARRQSPVFCRAV